MYQNYQRRTKYRLNRIKIVLLLFLPFHAVCQDNNLNIKEKPNVSISLDSARLIAYNEHTTPLEVVTRNILGIIEVDPSYFIEQTEFTEFSAHAMKLSVDSINHLVYDTLKNDGVSILDSKTLSHEGGHVYYNVKNFHQYLTWLKQNPRQNKGGHGVGNPSGREADKQERIYLQNTKG